MNIALFKAMLTVKGKTLDDFAQLANMCKNTLYSKLNGTSDFTRKEIKMYKNFLDLNAKEIDQIFFA